MQIFSYEFQIQTSIHKNYITFFIQTFFFENYFYAIIFLNPIFFLRLSNSGKYS